MSDRRPSHRSRSRDRRRSPDQTRRRSADRRQSRSPDRRRRSRSPSAERSRRRQRSASRERRRSRSNDSDSKTSKKTSDKRATRKAADYSSSSESDSSDSASSSDSDDARRRRRSSKKASSKKSKKDKKSKKSKKSHKKKASSSLAINQNEYGKYGILRETDFHAKAVSFQAWLRDVKKIPDFNGPKYEAMDHFRDYMEDYNTATLPHEKYYDVEKYEQRKFAKEQAKRAKRHKPSAKEEEETAYAERMRQRADANKKEFALIMQTMDRSKIEHMREQQRLRDQMQMHYKAGNMDEARRLEHLLTKKDESKPEPEFKPDTGRHF
ncbi:hypothetical protein SDRG_11869 [Saprolegnia diclina VS20]|uniref:Uncharacterized protein n=1 Tax=Saprolegnia diclina (strain VS20) TaxID=1156394 RepID=T0RK20_SAPDV|nr:hypothetical protein SDRG_11869 [Saprolegnia diclina VS20]EQC30292.1 hypothetical protein SDRG_11869 [Saprolegnia diclina VS20]|eukprot:XP_008616145.1 hypothetical protein SDRG_11869 [Saprolegnia diclina VS20]